MKLEYTGFEDEIIKKIEVGNVSLPLNGTLITGSQSLLGIKTQINLKNNFYRNFISTKVYHIRGRGDRWSQTSEFDIY